MLLSPRSHDECKTQKYKQPKTNRRAKGKSADTNKQQVPPHALPPASGAVTRARAKLNEKALTSNVSLWQKLEIEQADEDKYRAQDEQREDQATKENKKNTHTHTRTHTRARKTKES